MSSHGSTTPFVVITGGKGGVGKTTVAANLAIELARSGARVLLIDLDFGLANLDICLGAEVEGGLEDFFDGTRELADCIQPAAGGVDLLPGGSGTPSMGESDEARRERLLAALAFAGEGYDVMIGDCAAGIAADTLGFAEAADQLLLVTTADPAALTDAYGLIKALHISSTERGREVPTPAIVVNQAASAAHAKATSGVLDSVCRRFLARSPRMAGWLPRSRAVEEGGLSRKPFVLGAPESLSTACLGRIARGIARRSPESASRVAS